MTRLNDPPLYEPVIEQDGVPTLAWTLFFNRVSSGDSGTNWIPSFVGLTEVGSASFSGIYFRLSRKLVYFRVVITPGTNTSATAGTTYIQNFPLPISGGGACLAVAEGAGLGIGLGVVGASSGRIFMPSWTTVAVPITVTGMMEAG